MLPEYNRAHIQKKPSRSYVYLKHINFSHINHNHRGKSKYIDDRNMDGIESLKLSRLILSSAAQIRFYQTIGSI